MTDATACPLCASPVIQPRQGRRRLYCSKLCSRRAHTARLSAQKQVERRAASAPCEACGGVIEPGIRGPIPRFCSIFCQEVSTGRRLAAPYPDRICELDGCDNRFTPKQANQKCCCEAHGKRHFNIRAKAEGRVWPGRPETRRANLRRKTQQRRARTKGDANAELIDRDDVGERDNWACGLCDKPVDKTLPYPDPKSPSLDHVVPLAKGGKHTLSNVQIAHLDCNVAKGDRVETAA